MHGSTQPETPRPPGNQSGGVGDEGLHPWVEGHGLLQDRHHVGQQHLVPFHHGIRASVRVLPTVEKAVPHGPDQAPRELGIRLPGPLSLGRPSQGQIGTRPIPNHDLALGRVPRQVGHGSGEGSIAPSGEIQLVAVVEAIPIRRGIAFSVRQKESGLLKGPFEGGEQPEEAHDQTLVEGIVGGEREHRGLQQGFGLPILIRPGVGPISTRDRAWFGVFGVPLAMSVFTEGIDEDD